MSVLYVVEHGAKVYRRGEQIAVEKDGEDLAEIELSRLSSVVALNTVQFTTQALCALLEAGIELAFITSRGDLLGQLTPPLARNLALRKAQFHRETDPEFVLKQSKAIVAAKAENQRQVLVRHSLDKPGRQTRVQAAAEGIERAAKRIETVTSVDSLLGIEGECAALYWGAFADLLLADGVPFPGRRKRPPPDPVNAVLSLGYTLLTNLLTATLDAYGFDPWLGFLHSETYGHPSLALDLVEPFRAPVVDRMTLRVFNLRILTPGNFRPYEGGGIRLDDDGLRSFFREWERTLARLSIREAIKTQMEQLARVYRGQEDEVKPWLWSARQN